MHAAYNPGTQALRSTAESEENTVLHTEWKGSLQQHCIGRQPPVRVCKHIYAAFFKSNIKLLKHFHADRPSNGCSETQNGVTN
jgi:hypothetical protein